MSRILFVTRNFPPLVGGMERLALEAVEALKQAHEVELTGPVGCTAWQPNLNCVEVPAAPMPSFLFSSWHAARRLARRRPRWVIGASGLVAPAVLHAARLGGARSALFVHGLDLVEAHPVYRRLFLPAIRRADLIIANSANTAELARVRGVSDERIRVLHPGVGLPTADKALALPAISPQREPTLLFVGRLTPRKGLLPFLEQTMPRILAESPQVRLIVVGDDPSQAARRQTGISAQLRQRVQTLGLSGRVIFRAGISDQELADTYQKSDLLVFPILDLPHDVEGFGMVVLEAAARGVPTVAFAAGGVPDAVGQPGCGALVSPGDYAGFAATVLDWLRRLPDQKVATACRQHAEGFAWERFGHRLRALLAEGSKA